MSEHYVVQVSITKVQNSTFQESLNDPRNPRDMKTSTREITHDIVKSVSTQDTLGKAINIAMAVLEVNREVSQ